MKASDVLKWRKTEEEVPQYKLFGHSPEVVGLWSTGYLNTYRQLCRYIKGDWYTTENDEEVEPPIMWHYLPAKPNL